MYIAKIDNNNSGDRLVVHNSTSKKMEYRDLSSITLGGNAIYTVAASNTPTLLKGRADYICDGTADESEIQTALGLGDVQLLPGTYNISTTGIQMASNRMLRGSGDSTVLVAVSYTTSTKMITNTGSTGITLRDFTIDGASGSMGYGVYFELVGSGTSTTSVMGCLIDNLYIKDAWQSAVELRSCRYSIISRCRFDNPHWDAIVLKKKVGETKGCIYININNNISNNSTAFVWLQSAEQINITSNNIEGDTSNGNGQIGIQIENTSLYVNIVGNVFTNTGESFVNSNDTCTYINITGNSMINTASQAIYLLSPYSIISNNTIEKVGGTAISLEGDNLLITGNYITEYSQTTNNTSDGIVYAFGTDAVISNNLLNVGTLTNKGRYGIRVTAGTTNCFITGNDCSNGGTTAAFSVASATALLSDNIDLTGVFKKEAITTSQYKMATARILGRSTASTGAIEEISIGSGLSLSAGTLSTTGTGSGITRTIVVTSGSIGAGSTASTDYVYLVAGAHTITMPTAVGNTNRYTIKNNDSTNCSSNKSYVRFLFYF